jgi:L-iditol 2-dehydrogenase
MPVPATMKVGAYYRNDNVQVEERPVPAIGQGEVLVRVAACGICGSDTMQWYREPQARSKGGINSGHEIAGEIVQVDDRVQNYKVHDRVVVAHHFPCGNCLLCRDGNETACEAMHDKYIDPGGFAQYVRVLEKGVHHGLYLLPDSMTYAQGSFVEPLGCVVRSVRKTGPPAAHTVLVIGSGLAGLLHIKLLRALGAGRIFAVDTNASRLEVASRCGADEMILAPGEMPRADRVYVCTAAEAACENALKCVTGGGQIMYFATGGPDMKLSLPLTKFWLTQTAINFAYGAAPRDMREAMELIRCGTVSVDDLATHRFGIDHIGEAFDLSANPRGNALKVLIEPNRGLTM